MKITVHNYNEKSIAQVVSSSPLITDTQSALDLLMDVSYNHQSNLIVINKEAVAEDFFILSTGMAGEILQKFVNYHVKFAVYGDFSIYTSKALKDFIYECNKGKHIFFAKDLDEAVEMIAAD
ncbi:DUF4180 domain-containing protein [Tyzzerella sp. OttesenSCG-928-J15]|nr:DUF4180 domain-containing protein [Tyzzerella sp. OttesenSCG-928-J15]